MNGGYWPFWAGGLALAVVAVGYLVATGRLLGVSGSLSGLLRRPGGGDLDGATPDELEAALLAATLAEFGDAAPASGPVATTAAAPVGRFTWSAHATLLAGLVLGGTIASRARGAFHVRTDLGAEFGRLIGHGWPAWAALVGGGLLVGFGTAMAGGCTSGHGLCGTSRAQPGSLVTTAAFFGAAVLVALGLDAVAR